MPRWFADPRALVECNDVDAISIAVPPAAQVEIARLALESGKHVLAEKPLACSPEQSEGLVTLARGAGVAHMVNLEMMECAAFRRAKELADGGAIGRLTHIVVNWQVETYANRLGVNSWKTSSGTGGGALYAFLSHVLYYVEGLAGPAHRLMASMFKQPTDARSGDTLDVVCLECVSGVTASITVGTHSPLGSGHRVELYGSDGSLILQNASNDYIKGFQLSLGTRTSGRHRPVDISDAAEETSSDGRIAATARVVGRFVDWIQHGHAGRPSFDDGHRVQQLLRASEDSAVQGQWVRVAGA